jgi:hypothetical protein
MKQIYDLPDYIIDLIQEFINPKKLVFVNKKFYNLYHYTIKQSIPLHLYDKYIRNTIERDNLFVFERIIGENFDSWLKNKQYRYKNMVFNNYIYFVMHFCIEHDSQQCLLILLDFLLKRDLCKNLHKKNVVKYIKWMN